MTKSFIAPLPAWGLIHATGPDAEAFLHGQLTNDLLHLPQNTVQWSGYCSAKGRLLASFLVWRDGADGFFLACDKALAPALTKRLRMFVLRAKVVIDDASDKFTCLGMAESEMAGAPMAAALTTEANTAGTGIQPISAARQDGAWRVALPTVDGLSRTLVFAAADQATNFIAAQNRPIADTTDWTRLMIKAGEAWITPVTQEAFVPQMINFDAIGGVNFKKGCYPGQEIVARAHYRGAVKRRMYRAQVDAPAKPGDALFGSGVDGQECGLIVMAAPAGNGSGDGNPGDKCSVTSEILAVVQMQSQATGEVRLGAADGPLLRFDSLPYAIPEPA